jgi:hypothetical protein
VELGVEDQIGMVRRALLNPGLSHVLLETLNFRLNW